MGRGMPFSLLPLSYLKSCNHKIRSIPASSPLLKAFDLLKQAPYAHRKCSLWPFPTGSGSMCASAFTITAATNLACWEGPPCFPFLKSWSRPNTAAVLPPKWGRDGSLNYLQALKISASVSALPQLLPSKCTDN